MLTGQAKTDYQREYMRGYMRERRNSVKTQENVKTSVKTQAVPVFSKVAPVIDVPVVVESIRDRLARTPLAELEKKGGWIPNWRREQG